MLRDIAERTGGKELLTDQTPEEMAQTIYGNRKPKRSSRPIFDWYLMGLACLLPLDVAVRRVQLDFAWLKKLLRRERKESTATMGALLQRAGEVRSSLNSQRDANAGARKETTVSQPMTSRPMLQKPAPSTGTNPETKPTPPATPAPPADDGGTTSRLLAMKKKREQDGSDDKK